MREATLYTLDIPTNRLAAYETGVADGNTCRQRGNRPSLFLLVARHDDYSAGFRAGFFQRAFEKAAIAIASEEIEHREVQGMGHGKGGG